MLSRLVCSRSLKTSAKATSLQFASAPKAFAAAPVPRPPHPTKPIFSRSLPAAWALPTIDRLPANAPAVTKAELVSENRGGKTASVA